MEQRFLSKINKIENGCWEWTGATRGNGYGEVMINYKQKLTHRVAYELWKGEIPDGYVVRHKCRSKSCCNPEHLEVGTYSENAADKKRDGTTANGEKHGLAKLTEQQVLEIRAINNMTQREIAKMYGISQTHVGRIINRKWWFHI